MARNRCYLLNLASVRHWANGMGGKLGVTAGRAPWDAQLSASMTRALELLASQRDKDVSKCLLLYVYTQPPKRLLTVTQIKQGLLIQHCTAMSKRCLPIFLWFHCPQTTSPKRVKNNTKIHKYQNDSVLRDSLRCLYIYNCCFDRRGWALSRVHVYYLWSSSAGLTPTGSICPTEPQSRSRMRFRNASHMTRSWPFPPP